MLLPHSYQKQLNMTETFPQNSVQSTTKIFPNISSNKTCYITISLTHQAVGLIAPTTVTGLTEEVTLDRNSFNTQFFTHTS